MRYVVEWGAEVGSPGRVVAVLRDHEQGPEPAWSPLDPEWMTGDVLTREQLCDRDAGLVVPFLLTMLGN
jgi:hypothetical protein